MTVGGVATVDRMQNSTLNDTHNALLTNQNTHTLPPPSCQLDEVSKSLRTNNAKLKGLITKVR